MGIAPTRRRRSGEETGRPTLSLFVEARFARDETGGWGAMDPTSGAGTWRRYARGGVALRLVARAKRRTEPGLAALDGTATVAPLPYYLGLRGLVPALPRLAAAITGEVARAEVVLLRLPGVVPLLAAAACRLLRRTYSVEVVGDPVAVLTSGALGRPGRALAPLARWQMRTAVGGAAAALYVTGSTLQCSYPHRAGAVAVSVSGARLGDDAFRDGGRRWQPGPVRILTIGSQELPYKGHDVLLRALHRMRVDGVDARAVIVGGGRTHAQLVDLAESLGVGDAVVFTGAVHDRSRLLELLDEASLFALPSLTEGLPRALLEAMARALPAVGSDVGGIPELLDGRWLVPAGDPSALAGAMTALAADRSEWEAQSLRNLRTARRYSSDVLDARFTEWLGALPRARGEAGR
ncbi:glycosyltransferase family 4 protein [Geodermatophilus sp. CPCC 206100]|uniref:glycosyltransferase family 4 protein n=1 Tax=Geodermatophilus sp. CPCC 206100 TaxID=3020054 RepID=UPI003B009B10